MKIKQQTFMLRQVFHSQRLKAVCKNPYLWSTNKTVVTTITIHSCTNSMFVDICGITQVKTLHTSDGYTTDGQRNSYFKNHW
jgi:hypothetical protein